MAQSNGLNAARPAPPAGPPACPPERFVEAADLPSLGHLLPPTAVSLLRVLGPTPALALMRQWPGVQVPVPLGTSNPQGAKRWADIAAVIGADAMPTIAAHWGGSVLDVPTCKDLLVEKRNRWVRDRFDHLVSAHGHALSAFQATAEICLALAQAGQPITHREVEKTINRIASPAPAPQLDIFTGA